MTTTNAGNFDCRADTGFYFNLTWLEKNLPANFKQIV